MAKYDASGAASGALAGAGYGSAFGPIGTGVGAVAGGLLGLFASKKKKPKKLSTMDKTQQQIYNQYAQAIQGQGPMAGMFDFDADQARDVFKQMYADPAYQQFNEEIVPGITGQFRGGNLQNSSYLSGALGKAGTDVQKNLNANLANMLYQGQQSSIDRRLGALNNILGMQTFAYEKPQAGPFDQLIGGFASGAGQYAGQNFMNWMKPAGAGAGG